MTLLALMFHRARPGPDGNDPAVLDQHFEQIARRCHCVLPGEPLRGDRLNVCLTFDDAYCDFPHVVLPILERHRLRAILAVSPGLIVDRPELTLAQRLDLSTAQAFARPALGGFCTWRELQEIAHGGVVAIASHGFNHRRLDDLAAPLHEEIVLSRQVLEARLGVAANTFVFPFGRFSPAALALARRNYGHAFRIGSALNFCWKGSVLYRVAADNLSSPSEPLRRPRLFWAGVRYGWNRLRRR